MFTVDGKAYVFMRGKSGGLTSARVKVLDKKRGIVALTLSQLRHVKAALMAETFEEISAHTVKGRALELHIIGR